MQNTYYAIASKYIRPIKAGIIFLLLICIGFRSGAQNILFVNDNDNIVYNTDTVISDMNHTTYSSYHYWNIMDSAGATPSFAFLSTFDLVIWYCSTDGVGLKIWTSTGNAGNPSLDSYAVTGKPLWIIGLDILYQKYTAGSTFTSGEFPKDIMGLTSYDVQSYIDDGSAGCPEADRISTASSLFPATILWNFPTLWYVDGCTPDAGTLSLYQMGPSSYTLNGKKCMFHNKHTGISVMSTFFDPALIDAFPNRVNFLQKSITYLLDGFTGLANNTSLTNSATLYPNPASSTFTLEINSVKANDVSVELYNGIGILVSKQNAQLTPGKNFLETTLNNLSAGIYAVRVTDASGQFLYVGKLTKQ